MNTAIKKILIKYGYFCLIMFALFLLLTLSTVLTRKSWTLGLKSQIQDALDEALPEESLVVGDAIQIEQPLSVSAAVYELTSSTEETEKGLVVLVRVTGIAGPAPALFVRSPEQTDFSYIGIIGDDQFYNRDFSWYKIAYRQIQYWQNRIPLIIGEAK